MVTLISDIDECELGGAECTQGCRNLRGSYSCTCEPGYQLGTDGKSCYRMSCHNVNVMLVDGLMLSRADTVYAKCPLPLDPRNS